MSLNITVASARRLLPAMARVSMEGAQIARLAISDSSRTPQSSMPVVLHAGSNATSDRFGDSMRPSGSRRAGTPPRAAPFDVGGSADGAGGSPTGWPGEVAKMALLSSAYYGIALLSLRLAL